MKDRVSSLSSLVYTFRSWRVMVLVIWIIIGVGRKWGNDDKDLFTVETV